jgi:hypothetical protein
MVDSASELARDSPPRVSGFNCRAISCNALYNYTASSAVEGDGRSFVPFYIFGV